jgi:hypothetical protein
VVLQQITLKKFQTLTLGGVHFEDDTTAAMHARGIEIDDDKLIVSMVNGALMGLIIGMLGIIPTQEPHLSE